MKLVEMAARKMKEWTELGEFIYQGDKGYVFSEDGILLFYNDLAEDWFDAKVTRAQWEAERARIRKEEGYKAMLNDAKDISEKSIPVSLGFRMEEDIVSEDQAMWDDIAKAHFKKVCTEEYSRFQFFAEIAFDAADEFMAERAKRMKG